MVGRSELSTARMIGLGAVAASVAGVCFLVMRKSKGAERVKDAPEMASGQPQQRGQVTQEAAGNSAQSVSAPHDSNRVVSEDAPSQLHPSEVPLQPSATQTVPLSDNEIPPPEVDADEKELMREKEVLDLIEQMLGARRVPEHSHDDSFAIGHVSVDSPPLQSKARPLSEIPPLRIVPSLKLLDEDQELMIARRKLEDGVATSSSSSGEQSPRVPSQRRVFSRRKLLRVTELLNQLADCLEKERHRVVELLRKDPTLDDRGVGDASSSLPSCLEALRKLESSIDQLSLRKLVGAARCTTLTAHLIANLSDETGSPATANSDDLQGTPSPPCDASEREAIDKTPHAQEESDVAGGSIMSGLSAFASFIFAKEMIAQDRLGPVTRRLLFHAIDSLPAMPEHTQRGADAQSIPAAVSVSFPFGREAPFYEPWLWYVTGQILEMQDGCVESMAVDHARMLPNQLVAAQRFFNVASQPAYVAAYLMALLAANGNHGAAWMSLALCLEANTSIELLGKTIYAPLQCVAEAIRCNNGFVHCTSYALWTEAAAVLEFSHVASQADGARLSSHGAIDVTTSAHAAFLTTAVDDVNTVPCTRRDCLIKAASLPAASTDPAIWLQLGMTLNIGRRFERIVDKAQGVEQRILSMNEESVDVAGMQVTRYDCYALSLAIDPTSSSTWYRVGLGLEDKVRVLQELEDGRYTSVDPIVYQRSVLGVNAPPIDRETAFLFALKEGSDDCRVWFAMATTLYERNMALEQPEGQQVRIPRSLLVGRGRSSERLDASPLSSPTQPSSGVQYGDAVSVSAGTLFQKCVQLKPSMEGVIGGWISKHQL